MISIVWNSLNCRRQVLSKRYFWQTMLGRGLHIEMMKRKCCDIDTIEFLKLNYEDNINRKLWENFNIKGLRAYAIGITRYKLLIRVKVLDHYVKLTWNLI